jgi:hypothetical protein
MPYSHHQYFTGYTAQIQDQLWYLPNKPRWLMQNQQWKYQNYPQTFLSHPQSFPSQPQMKNQQWSNPPQGWRPKNQYQQALIPPPTQ